ncbi:hypothetical protein JR338_00855 [Chloroflexota bacterium]|nr:hypothetical protein JR338_00855 [Chloroflexota bacterium]
MKNRAWLVGLILILALSACSLPTQTVETPTVEETSVAHSTEEIVTETEVATETAAATEGPELPLPIVYGVGEELVVLDPATGAEINRIAAPGFGYGGNGGVTENGVFYVDSDYQNAFRVGFDGVVQELLFLNPDGGYFEGVILPSPDGSKIAQGAVLSFDASGSHVQLKVVNVDGSGEQILVDLTLDRPLRPTPIKWSADGETLYYMNVMEGIEGYGGQDLFKVYLDTSMREQTFPETSPLVSTSVSPNETYAARAVPGDPTGIMIRDLVNLTNQTVTLPDKYKQVWQMVWAPDESALLVTVGLGMFMEGDTYSVIKIDMTTLELSYLVTDDVNLLRAVAWQVPETIWFQDTDSTLWMMNAGDLTLTMVALDARFVPISQ